MRIVLTGGGTGGHVLPFEAVIAALRTQFVQQQGSLPARLNPSQLVLTFVGPADARAREFFSHYDVQVVYVPSGKLRRYVSGLTIFDVLWRLPMGIILALVRCYLLMPDAVISMGGYGSVPAVLAATFYRIPILLHEMNAMPGLANRRLLPRATAISLGLPAAKEHLGKQAYKALVTGNPVRADLHRLDKKEAKAKFGIPDNEHVLLVTGGSQGAKQLNEMVLQILPTLVLDVTIIHITGNDHFAAVSAVASELLAQSSRKQAYLPFAYLADTMTHALVAADSMVTRAGAATLAEIASLRTPALLIPLPSAAQDHQRANAQAFEAVGGALVLDPVNLTRNLFGNNVRRLTGDAEVRAQLTANLALLDHPDAASKIADTAFQLSQGFAPTKQKLENRK